MTAKDIRFTMKDSVLYAIVMGRPVDNMVIIQSMNVHNLPWFGEIGSITLIGEEAPLLWSIDSKNLTVRLPNIYKEQLAYVLKIRRK
ncbi:MAG: alpha-L-fucosidase C-terminal domain-containing protein [Bacteroidota bacterium]